MTDSDIDAARIAAMKAAELGALISQWTVMTYSFNLIPHNCQPNGHIC